MEEGGRIELPPPFKGWNNLANCLDKPTFDYLPKLAQAVGFEPTTFRLTAELTTIVIRLKLKNILDIVSRTLDLHKGLRLPNIQNGSRGRT